MLTTTLQTIWDLLPKDEEGNPQEGNPTGYWNALLNGLGKTGPDDEPVTLLRILESCGMKCAHATSDAFHGHTRVFRLYACYCARYLLHFFEEAHSGEMVLDHILHRGGKEEEIYIRKESPRKAIEAAEKFARGLLSAEEMIDAWREVSCGRISYPSFDESDPPHELAKNAAVLVCMEKSIVSRHMTITDVVATMLPLVLAAFPKTQWGPDEDKDSQANTQAREDLRREFVRLCKLEGEYGEADLLDKA